MALAAAQPSAAAILSRKDVRTLDVLVASHKPLTLMITGTAADAASSVDGISTQVRGDSLYVLVEIGPAQPRLSPSFEFTVVVPEGIAYVRFGPDGDTIWPR